MKNLLLLLLVQFNFFYAIGQISTIEVKTNNNLEIEPISYDSSEFEINSEVAQLIGQEIYLKPKKENFDKEMGYSNFLIDYKKGDYDKGNYYACCSRLGNSKYEKISGKYFKVLSILRHPKAIENPLLYGDSYYLKLKRKDNGDECFYRYSIGFTLDFVVVGYYEKQRRLLPGKQFIMRNRKYGSYIDINSGKIIQVQAGSIWKCVDVGLEPEGFSPAMILESVDGERIYLNTSWLKFKMYAFELTDGNDLMSRFGNDNWDLILKGKVKIGMTKEMAQISLGIPKHINRTITANNSDEQWVYEDKYLYFTNGLITAIQ